MPTFMYKAVDATGRRSKGRLSGATEAAVVQTLESQGLLPLDVVPASTGGGGGGFAFGRRRAVLEFTRAVAALLPAGMPLSRALEAGTTASSQVIRPQLEQVRARIERGDELATAFAEHPQLFSSLYVGVVRAGEKSGSLDRAFDRLSNHLERDDELRSKLVSMSIYPALLATVGVGAVLVLVLFVLPTFAELLEGSGAALPRSTAIMLAVVSGARENWMILLAIIPVVAISITWLKSTEGGRRFGSELFVRLPVFGQWRRQVLGAQFARIVGELVSGGAPLFSALRDARDCMTDSVVRDETERIRTRIREGASLNISISERELFPEVLHQLVALGEEAGRLSDFLLKAAEMLERRTEQSMERLVALVEPAMIVTFGSIVGLVALALLQAIYGVNAGGL